MKRRARDKQKNYMIIVNTWLFGLGSVLVFYHWYSGLAQKNQDILTSITQLTVNDKILLSTVALLIGGLFYSIVILRPDMAKRQREKELLTLTIEATHHNDYTDSATGFYNHLYFEKTLNSYLSEFNVHEKKLGIFFIDIVANTAVPDDLLKEIGNILLNTARDYDIVARTGVSRFGVITPHIKTEDLGSIRNRIMSKLKECENLVEEYTYSIGKASNDQTTNTLETIQAAASNSSALNQKLAF